LSHHAGVIFSGLKLRARTFVNGTSSATKGKSYVQPRVWICMLSQGRMKNQLSV